MSCVVAAAGAALPPSASAAVALSPCRLRYSPEGARLAFLFEECGQRTGGGTQCPSLWRFCEDVSIAAGVVCSRANPVVEADHVGQLCDGVKFRLQHRLLRGVVNGDAVAVTHFSNDDRHVPEVLYAVEFVHADACSRSRVSSIPLRVAIHGDVARLADGLTFKDGRRGRDKRVG